MKDVSMKYYLLSFLLVCFGYSAESYSMGDQPVCFVSHAALQPGTYNIGIISEQKDAWKASLKTAENELKNDLPGKYEGVVFEYSFISPEEDKKLKEINYTSVVLASDKANAIPSSALTDKDIMFVESEFSKEAVKEENSDVLVNAAKHILLGVSAVAGNDRKPMITQFTSDHLKKTMDSQAIDLIIKQHEQQK